MAHFAILLAYYTVNMKSNGNKASPYFRHYTHGKYLMGHFNLSTNECIRWLINWSDSTKMHGATIRFIVNAQQAKLNNIYKNTKLKLLKTNAAIWFNKMWCIRWLINWSDSTKIHGATIRFISNGCLRRQPQDNWVCEWKRGLCHIWKNVEILGILVHVT